MITTSSSLTKDDHEAKSGDSNTTSASSGIDYIFMVHDMQGAPKITKENDPTTAIEFGCKWVANTSPMKLFVIKDENDFQNMSHLVQTKEELEFLIKDHPQRDPNKPIYFMVLPQIDIGVNVTFKAVDNKLNDLVLDIPLLMIDNKREKRFYGVCDTLLAPLWAKMENKLNFNLSFKFSTWKQFFSLYFVVKKQNDNNINNKNDNNIHGNNVDVTSEGGEDADEAKRSEKLSSENVNMKANASEKKNSNSNGILVKSFADLVEAMKTWVNMINARNDDGMDMDMGKQRLKLELRSKDLDHEFDYIKIKLYQRYNSGKSSSVRENLDSEAELEFLIDFFKQRRDIRAGKMKAMSASFKFNRGRNLSSPRQRPMARSRSPRARPRRSRGRRMDSTEKSQEVEEKTEDVDVLPFDGKESAVVKQALQALKQLLKYEGFIEYDGDRNSHDIEKAEKCYRKENIVCETLGNVLKRVRPFDFDKFISRCEEHKNACQELIGKDCIMFVGNTGIGKSTSIHYLMGSKMKQDSHRKGHVIPVKYSKELNRIQLVSQISNSVTSFIIPIKLKCKNNDNIYLCDTPGWNDSSTQNSSIGDYELEIANLMGFVDAMNNCNRAAIITLIASDEFTSTGRAFGLKNVCKKLRLLLKYYEPEDEDDDDDQPDDDQWGDDRDESKEQNGDVENAIFNKLRNIKFVFTKVGRIQNNDDLDNIGNDVIERMCQIADESTDNDLIVAKMIRDEGWEVNDVIAIDPLSEGVMLDGGDDGEGGNVESQDLREWTLDVLFDDIDKYWIGGSQLKSISTGRNYFRYNVPGQQIKMQIERVTAHIRTVLSCGLSVNFKLIEKKLEQLKKLESIFQNNEHATHVTKMVSKGYNDCISMIKTKINTICDNQISRLKSYGSLSLETFKAAIIESKEILDEFLDKCDNIQVKYLHQDNNTITTKMMQKNIENVFKTMLLPDTQLSITKKHQLQQLLTSLWRVDIFLQQFPQCTRDLKRYLANVEMKVQNMIQENNWEEVGRQADTTKQAVHHLRNTKSNSQNDGNGSEKHGSVVVDLLRVTLVNIRKMILNHLEKGKIQFIDIIGGDIKDSNTHTMEQCYNVLKNGYKVFCLRKGIANDIDDNKDGNVLATEINNYYTEVTASMIASVNKCCENVKSQLVRSPPLSIDSIDWNYIKMNVSRIHWMMEIEILQDSITFNKQMDDVIDSIVSYFRENMDFDKQRDLEIMKQCSSWMKQFGSDLSVFSDKFEQTLTTQLVVIMQAAQKLDAYSTMTDFGELIDRLKEVSTYCNSKTLIVNVKRLQSRMNRVINILKGKLSATIGSIIDANMDLGRLSMKDLIFTNAQLCKLKEEYGSLYYEDGVMNVIRNKCLPMFATNDGNQMSIDDLSSENIFNACERARMECIIAEYDAAVGQKSTGQKLKSAMTKPMKVGNHPKQIKKKHVLQKYTHILQLASTDELADRIEQYKRNVKTMNDGIRVNRYRLEDNDLGGDDDEQKTRSADSDVTANLRDVLTSAINNFESMTRSMMATLGMQQKLQEPDIRLLGEVIEHKASILDIEKILKTNCEITKEEIMLFREEKYLSNKIRQLSHYIEIHKLQFASNDTDQKSEHYFLKKLNCDDVELLLKFIKSYNSIQTINKERVSLIDDVNINKVRKHLKEYGKFRMGQVRNGLAFFESVIITLAGGTGPNDNTSRLVTKNSSDLSHLKELIDIKSDSKAYSNVIEYTFDSVEQFAKDTMLLEQNLAELCHHTNVLFESQEHWTQSKHLPLIRACVCDLSQMDPYFTLADEQEKTFTQLKIMLSKLISTDSTLTMLKDAADNGDYYTVRDRLNDCKAQAKAEQELKINKFESNSGESELERTQQYKRAAMFVPVMLRDAFDKYQRRIENDDKYTPQTWQHYVNSNPALKHESKAESKDESKDKSKAETTKDTGDDTIDSMIKSLNTINECSFWSHFQIEQEEDWQLAFDRYLKLRCTIILNRSKLIKVVQSHLELTIDQDDSKIVEIQGMLEVLEKVYSNYNGEIKIKPDHQLLKMTTTELNSKSRLFGMAPMPSEEVQHELNRHVDKQTKYTVSISDMNENSMNKYLALFGIIVKSEKLCQKSSNKEQQLFYNQKWKYMKREMNNTINTVVNEINHQKREVYKTYDKVEWLKEWKEKLREKEIIDSNEMITINKCITSFEARKGKEDSHILQRLEQRLNNTHGFQAAFRDGFSMYENRFKENDESMINKLEVLFHKATNEKLTLFFHNLEANTVNTIPTMMETYDNIEKLANEKDIANSEPGSTLWNALDGMNKLFETKTTQFCDTVTTKARYYVKESIEREKLKDEIKFVNVLFDEKYCNMVKAECVVELRTKLSKFFDSLVDQLDACLRDETEINIDNAIDVFQQLNIVIELEKEYNIVKIVKILGTRLYTKAVTKWTNFLTSCQDKIVNNSPIINIDNFSSQNNSARMQYYRQIQQQMIFLERSLDVSDHISNIDSAFTRSGGFFDECKRSVYNQTNQLCRDIETYIATNESFVKIDKLYNNVVAVHEVGIVTGNLYQKIKEAILKELGHRENRFRKLIDDNSGKKSIAMERAECLLYLEKAVCHFSNDEIKDSASGKVQNCLVDFAGSKPFQFRDLAKVLENMEKPNYVYAREIIGNYGMFNGQVTKWWNDKIKFQSIDQVVANMQENAPSNSNGTGGQTKKLYKCYKQYYDELFLKILKRWNTNNDEFTNLLDQKVFSSVEKLVDRVRDGNLKQHDTNKAMLKLMAHVLCIWTFLESSYYWSCARRDSRVNSNANINGDEKKADTSDVSATQKYPYLRQPHVVQVVAIIRLLGLHNPVRKGITIDLNKNFIQIGTGEGKSLIVATIACILGLIGWEVYCTSYSKELSNRDRDAFLKLFRRIGVAGRVFYGTFEELSEILIKQNVDFAQRVRELFDGNYDYSSNANGSSGRSRLNSTVKLNNKASETILIVDEVDVLFDRKKISKTLSKVAHIRNENISKICDLIWNNRTKIKSTRDLHNVDGYKQLQQKCLNSFDEKLATRIKREINDMVQDIQIFRNFQISSEQKPYNYVVKNDKIGHRVNDYVDFNTNRRYKTLFAYYYENELNTISDESLKRAKYLLIVCCSFSFALMPKMFSSIIGVTATLDKLSQNQLQLLKDEYNITPDKFTYMPTVFQKESNKKNINNTIDKLQQISLKFDKRNDVKAFDEKEFYDGLVQEIIYQRRKECPVLVFFINSDELTKFAKCQEFVNSDLSKNFKILSEQCTPNEKQQVIRDACDLNAITLATRIFGRGTDFQVVDEILEKDEIGGPHVIQTFFSEEESEEIQIQGRTARYGGKGSYSMILSKSMVKKRLKIDLDQSSVEKSVYKRLDRHRERLQASGYEKIMDKIRKSKKQHQVSQELLSVLTAKANFVDIAEVAKYLDALKDQIDGQLGFMDKMRLGI